MFDFGRIIDTVTSMVGGAGANNGVDSIVQSLGESGIDPSMLQGLDATEIMNVLSQHGVDLSQFDASQLTDLVGRLGEGQHVVESVGQWLSDRMPRS